MFQVKLLLIGLVSLWHVNGVISSAGGKIVNCYVGTWANYRDGDGAFKTTHIDPFLCTHLSYAFFGINDETGQVIPLDKHLDFTLGHIAKMVALKKINPKLKVTLVVGGWNEGSAKYSKMAANPNKRRTFIESAVKLIKENGFDGFDLDWEYPSRREGSNPSDKQNFVILLKELYKALKPLGLELGVAVGASVVEADKSYDVAQIAQNVDFINLMTYDFATAWDGVVGYNAPLEGQGRNNLKDAVNYWLSHGAPASKLVLGLGFYGQTFKLSNPQKYSAGSQASGSGSPGPFTKQAGFLGYNEICSMKENWSYEWISENSVPILHNSRELISYDDVKSLELKVDLSTSLNLAGVMIWSIETDDFHGKCGDGKFPLLRAVNNRIGNPVAASSKTQSTSNRSVKKDNFPAKQTPQAVHNNPISSLPSSQSVNEADCKEKELHPHKLYCNWFIHCNAGVGYEKQCPPQLYFDPSANVCNWPDAIAPEFKSSCTEK